MIQTVIKRDGRVVGYNEEKIKAAIRKAMITTEKGEDESLIQKITDRIGMNGKEQMSVEEIQDNVELELMKSSRKEVAKRYIAYRDQRSIARRAKTRDIFLEIIEAKSNASRYDDEICQRDNKTVCRRLPPLTRDSRRRKRQLSAHPRQRLLSDKESHLRAASARQSA